MTKHQYMGIETASEFADLCKLISWERPESGYLLAGWCAIAPLCGALNWRPNIWLTGSAGTGKSWIFQNIVRRMLAKTCISVQGSSTEAGLRQLLGSDALPVLFDEAEGEDQRAQSRMQDVLSLMRGASTHEGGDIAKGTVSGKAIFAYASIGVQLTQASDRSRVSVLGIKRFQGEDGKAKFQRIKDLWIKTAGARGYAESMQARAIGMLPVILHNAQSFTTAAAACLADQRAGDQIGTLLAGYWSLVSDERISEAGALSFMQSMDFGV